MVEYVPDWALKQPISSEILGSGARLPSQSLRATPVQPKTVAAGETATIFDVKGTFRIIFAGFSDNGAGLMRYSAFIDSQSNLIPSAFIWQVVESLTGVVPTGGIFSESPTGFPASSFFTGQVTYITASFNTDASGNVADESLVIGYPYVYTLASLKVQVTNIGTSDAQVGGYLLTQPVLQE